MPPLFDFSLCRANLALKTTRVLADRIWSYQQPAAGGRRPLVATGISILWQEESGTRGDAGADASAHCKYRIASRHAVTRRIQELRQAAAKLHCLGPRIAAIAGLASFFNRGDRR